MHRLEEAISLGYTVTGETFGCPERGTYSAELRLGIEQPPVRVTDPETGISTLVSQPAKNEFVVPYTATCKFGAPRELRASDTF
jgi:hypothetical protein